ncbi:hypothetical protein A2U01_0094387, partial [Trifolium medium]|nr:hypothetical protein [Trifolium medium]
VHGSIPTEGKNCGEDREVAVSGPPKMGPWAVTVSGEKVMSIFCPQI